MISCSLLPQRSPEPCSPRVLDSRAVMLKVQMTACVHQHAPSGLMLLDVWPLLLSWIGKRVKVLMLLGVICHNHGYLPCRCTLHTQLSHVLRTARRKGACSDGYAMSKTAV